jgi:pyruvate,water dikinase
MTEILYPAKALDSPHAGGKARGLARMQRGGLTSPPWFVIPDTAFLDGPAAIRPAIDAAVAALCPGQERVAVRSSAIDEDGAHHAFAGQFETFLDVTPAEVHARAFDVWRSAFSPRVQAYRQTHGLRTSGGRAAVLVQRMVRPRVSGVAFSADPVSGRRGLTVISASAGVGSVLVAGEIDADTWHVDRQGRIVFRHLVAQDAVLTDEEVLRVAHLARAAERCAGVPQDVEWAIADALVLLQARAITSLRDIHDPDAPLTLWDNSNIVESYSGVTGPLTYSFARDIYEHVYRQFCRLMRVPESTIGDHDAVFRNMLGLVRGRMYYNLLNWHRMLALLPGYRVNRRFMEQMMGVKEELPAEMAEAVARGARRGRLRDGLDLARTMVGLLVHYLTLNRRVDAFSRRLERALAPPSPDLELQRPDELVAHYRDLRARLLLEWDAPLVNDLFAMIFYGALRQLWERWLATCEGAFHHELVSGEGGMVSAEPAVRMRRLARLASADPVLTDLLRLAALDEILPMIERRPDFLAEYRAYLDRFGERTVNELKLETVTLHEDPLPLLRAVGALAQQCTHDRERASPSSREPVGTAGRARVEHALSWHPLRRMVFSWVRRHARRRIRDRENLRLGRTRLFGRVRRIFLELGRRLHALDVLDHPRDVFHLEVEEVLAYVDGRSTCTDLRALAAVRAREFQAYRDLPAPSDRFETRGAVYRGHGFRRASPGASAEGDERRGLGCSPGVVRGRVRIVRDPAAAKLTERSILVAAHTDPGWIMIFPSALGVLVERGSLLSHAAIVARELGIPAVVSVPGLMQWLRDDDVVEMDGAAGTIRLIASSRADGVVRCA